MSIKHRVLLIIGILMLAKGAWALAFPESFRKVTAWWVRIVKHVNSLIGIVCIAVGLAAWALVLLHQPMVNWILGFMGVLGVCVGLMYFRMPEIERLTNAVVLNRASPGVRLLGVVLLVVALWVVWIALST